MDQKDIDAHIRKELDAMHQQNTEEVSKHLKFFKHNIPVLPQQEVINEHKITEQIKSNNELVIADYKLFHKYFIGRSISKIKEVADFLAFIEKIDRVCGCVRQQYRDKASDMYRMLLPMLDAKYKEELNNFKKELGVDKIIFKENANDVLYV